MANKYYIRSNEPSALDYGKFATRLFEGRENRKLTRSAQALTGKEIARRERVSKAEYPEGGGGLAEQRINVSKRSNQLREKQIDIQQQALDQKMKIPEEIFGRDSIAVLQSAVSPEIFSSLKPAMDILDGFADQGSLSKRDTYHKIEALLPMIKKPLLEHMQKEYEKVIKKNPVIAEQILTLMKMVNEDPNGVLNLAMPTTGGIINSERIADAAKLRPIPYFQTKAGVSQLVKGREDVARIGATTKETKEEKGLKNIKASYEKAIGRWGSAKRGENIMSEAMEEGGAEVAQQSLKTALSLALQYSKNGGDIKNLGLTAESIREAYQNKSISKDEAKQLLMKHF